MAKIFTGCLKATEVALCEVDPENGRYGGANPASYVLAAKRRVAQTEKSTPTGSEILDMTPEQEAAVAAKSVSNMAKTMAWSEVTKAHFLGLDAAAQISFMEKSVADQTTEADAAKKAKDDKETAEAAKAAGTTVEVADLQKSNTALTAQVAELLKANVERDKIAAIEKAATDPAFKGYPGGQEAVVAMLKTAADLPEAQGTAVRELMKANAASATQMAKHFGTAVDPAAAGQTGLGKVQKAVKDIAEARKIDINAAFRAFASEPEHAAAYAEALEQDSLAA